MIRYLITAAALLATALAAPAAAQAKVIELGSEAKPAASNCPEDPCVAAYQMTAYQGRADSVSQPFVVPRLGHIVAFTVSLGDLTPTQTAFFDSRFGDEPKVRLSILRRSKRKGKRLNHRLISQSEVFEVGAFLGSSPTFALSKPLRIGPNYIVALTVPTWAPVLDTVDLEGKNWWRSSRARGECGRDDELSPPSAHEQRTSIVEYRCAYFNSRLLYTATYVPDPRPTTTEDSAESRTRRTSRRARRSASAASLARPIVLGGGLRSP